MPSLKDTGVISKVANAAAAAQTTVKGSTIDMLGYDGILFIASLGAVTDGAIVGLQCQEGASADGSDSALPTGGANAVSPSASGSSNTALLSEIYRPLSRYVTPVLTRTIANAALDCIIAIKYGGRMKPTLQPANILAQALAQDV